MPAGFCQVGGPTNQLQHHSGLKGRGKSATNYYPLFTNRSRVAPWWPRKRKTPDFSRAFIIIPYQTILCHPVLQKIKNSMTTFVRPLRSPELRCTVLSRVRRKIDHPHPSPSWSSIYSVASNSLNDSTSMPCSCSSFSVGL